MAEANESGYARVNGLELYWESFGEGGTPVVVLHGGFQLISSCGRMIDALASRRRVVAMELQGHGHTRDVDRPFSYSAFGDDVAAAVEHLGLGTVDLCGYSLGAGAAIRAAIQHPDLVRKLVVVSAACRRDGWLPEVREGMDRVGRAGFEQMRQSPLYAAWRAVAPDPDAFPALMDKVGDLLRTPFDWTAEIPSITATTLLAYADNDSIGTSHVAEFYALLGGGIRDAGWDGSGASLARLAVIPGATHYDAFDSPLLAQIVGDFLG
jgi:pimeloyl-ACP methyl ester carboxylesterase